MLCVLKKKVMKAYSLYTLLLLIILVFQPRLHAQIKYNSYHKIYLSNGWVLQGDTSLVEDGKSLQIKTPDLQLFIFSLAEVDSIRKATFRTSRIHEIGYRNMLQIGFLLHNPEPLPGVDPSLIANFFSLSLQYVGTYKSRSGLGIGAGSGLNLFNRGYVMPLFLDLRGDLGTGLMRFHLYGQVGTSIPLYSKGTIEDFWGNTLFEDFEATGGLLLELGTGLKFMAREHYAWLISLGWRMQQITEEYKQWEIRYKDKYSFQRISFQVGFMF